MDSLPDITPFLVTPSNPARDPTVHGLDTARCVALHNYLILYAWNSQYPDSIEDPPPIPTYFTAYASDLSPILPFLHPSVSLFLKSALLPSQMADSQPFIFADNLCPPEDLFDNQSADLYDLAPNTFISLYRPGNCGQAYGGGVYYHQPTHSAAAFMHLDDHDFVFPIDQHRDLWHPLETILSNWIHLIRIEKVVASPHHLPSLFGFQKFGPWEWRPYSDSQVDTCLAAWEKLISAIETRVPTTTTDEDEHIKLLPPSLLDAASVADPSFARSFLTRARRPRFRYIAPGLTLPPISPTVFLSLQPSGILPTPSPNSILPLCIFPSFPPQPVPLNKSTNPFIEETWCLAFLTAGVYTESLERHNFDPAEEGFRLLLPYRYRGRNTGRGARRSDGMFVCGTAADVAELFQHGYKPFGGEPSRAQRLERLFECWTKLVEDGIWEIDRDGVKGGLGKFMEADSERWMNYHIPPTW